MFCSAAGARPGDGVEMEHAVRAWKEDNSGISVDERRELELERERDGARVLHFAVFYLYHRRTAAQGNKDPERNRGEG